jgi:hypothetical protein
MRVVANPRCSAAGCNHASYYACYVRLAAGQPVVGSRRLDPISYTAGSESVVQGTILEADQRKSIFAHAWRANGVTAHCSPGTNR